MALKLTNNASTTLLGAITSGATTINLATGDGAKFPTLAAGDWHPLTVTKVVSGVPVIEVMRVTARTVDAMTVTRAQEGTSAQAFSGGDRVELRATAAAFDALVQDGDNVSLGDVRGARFIDKTSTNGAATGAVTLDFSLGDLFELTPTGNITSMALSNAPSLSGETFTLVVRVTQGGTAYSVAWFTGVTWLTTGGTAPAAPAANKTVEYIFTTKDGTNWLGRKGASN